MELEKSFFRERSPYYLQRRGHTFAGWFAPHVVRRRVNDGQRRFHSEPRPSKASSRHQANGHALPPPPQNGHLVSMGGHNGSQGGYGSTPGNALPRDGMRLQSLPPNKPKVDSVDHRQVKSAPNNEGTKVGQGPSPLRGYNSRGDSNPMTQSRSRLPDNDPGKDLHQRTHGKATRAYEVKYLKSNKFASSWAQVRADNPTFNDVSPGHSPGRPVKGQPNPYQTPEYGSKTGSTRDSSPSNHDDARRDQKQTLHREHRSRPTHKTRGGAKTRFADNKNNTATSPGRADHAASGDESDAVADENKASPSSEQRDRRVAKKVEWDQSVAVPPGEKPPPQHVTLRYLDGLTFKPSINSKQDVKRTYNSPERTRNKDNAELNSSFSETEEGYESPANESYGSQDGSDDEGSKERQKKDPFLNRREARKYIKMNNVYGSEAFKNQRKGWFLQKLTEAQETKAKLEAGQTREERKKREEDKKKQKKQLDYVRRKFRMEQEHRFRTQYVTARVLEHERVNRHMYGLPEDYLDLGNQLNRAMFDDEDQSNTKDDSSENKENRLLADRDNNAKSNAKSKHKTSPTKKNVTKPPSLSPNRNDKKKTKEEETLEKMRQKQISWYAKPESDSVSPSTETRSHASHDTSGYESAKISSDHIIGNQEYPGERNDSSTNDTNTRNATDAKTKTTSDGKQNENPHAKKRLESQKNIYSRPAKKNSPVRQHGLGVRAGYNRETGKRQTMQNGMQPEGQSETKTDSDETNNGSTTPPSGPGSNKPVKNGHTPDTATDSNNNEATIGPNKGVVNYKNATALNRHGQGRGDTDSTLNNQNATISKRKPVENSGGSNSKQSGATATNTHNQQQAKNSTIANGENGDSKEPSKAESVTGVKESVSTRNGDKSTKSDTTGAKSILPNSGDSSYLSKLQKQSSHKDTLIAKNEESQNGNKQDKTKNNTANQPVVSDVKSNDVQAEVPKDTKDTKVSTSSKDQRVQNQMIDSKPVAKKQNERIPHVSEPQQGQNVSSNFTPKQSRPSSFSQSNAKPVPNSSGDSGVTGGGHSTKSKPSETHNAKQTRPRDSAVPTQKAAEQQHTTSRRQTTSNSLPIKEHRAVPSDDAATRPSHADTQRGRGDSKNSPNTKRKKKESIADRMFNINTGPTWDPNGKTPKMEGIDTVMVTAKDDKGRDVKKRKNVKDVVKEADSLLKVPHTDGLDRKKGSARSRRSRAVSDVTLGSDFEVDEDEELDDDLFERLRRKYNIQIDSDEEDNR